jgi:tetratricopeptide (TPR) repeat protein
MNLPRTIGLALAALLLATAPAARAQNEPPAKEASRHFQRGVDLYSEGDVRGALVEFKRAYALLPRATVLYNIGQAEYQLQEYAASLRTLEKFLAETGPNAPHRAEVQQAIEILRGRVGKIALTTDRNDCEVTIDDQVVGTTPLPEPVQVSVGRRRVAVGCAGAERVSRDLDVSAGDTVPLQLKLAPATAVAAAAPPAATATTRPANAPAPASMTRGTMAGWIVTAGLAAATASVYGAAYVESRRLDRLRRSYPITFAQLNDKARLTSRLALAGDVLAVSTLAAAGVSAYLRASSRARALEVDVAGLGLSLRGKF